MEKHSIKDGRVEAVMWILVKDNKILIEERPADEKGESLCIPAGHIDLNLDKTAEDAFLRECSEELQITPTDYRFLKTIDFDEEHEGGVDKLRLHYYVVNDWKGEIPEYTIENGKKHADLRWISIEKTLPQSCDREAIGFLKK